MSKMKRLQDLFEEIFKADTERGEAWKKFSALGDYRKRSQEWGIYTLKDSYHTGLRVALETLGFQEEYENWKKQVEEQLEKNKEA